MVRRLILTLIGCSVLALAALMAWRAYRPDPIVLLPFQWDATANTWFVELPGEDGIRLVLRDAFDHIDLEGEHALEIDQNGRKETARFRVGGSVSIGGEDFRCGAVRRWSGLLFDPMGAPMAAVSLGVHGAFEVENIFIRDAAWATIGADHAIRFAWADAPLPERLDPLLDARWGVIEGGTTHWFNSFHVGTGIALGDGTELALARVDRGERGPRIHVAQGKGNVGKKIVAVEAGRTRNNIIFDAPAAKPNVVQLVSGGPDRATAGRYLNGALVEHRELRAGDSWRAGDGFVMRLEQVMEHAAPVLNERSSLTEAVFDSSNRRLRIRQGETLRLDDTRLRFLPAIKPGGDAWELDQMDAQGRSVPVRLRPGETHSITTGAGRFTFAFEDIQPPQGIHARLRSRFLSRLISAFRERRPGKTSTLALAPSRVAP